MRQIVFTADDFGKDASINRAIIEAHTRGALGAASLMIGQPGTQDAIELALKNPRLQVGWHLHLCDAKPVALPSWPWNRSPTLAGLMMCFFSRRVESELKMQWNLYIASGIRCSFINSHHHLHAHPIVLRIVEGILATTPTTWLRGFNIRSFSNHLPAHASVLRCVGRRTLARLRSATRCSDTTWGLDRLLTMNAMEIERTMPTLGPGLHEFIFHPREIDDADFTALIGLAPPPS